MKDKGKIIFENGNENYIDTNKTPLDKELDAVEAADGKVLRVNTITYSGPMVLWDNVLPRVADELAKALSRLVRNGQKQGWTYNYEDDMEDANKALSNYHKLRGELKG